MRAKLLIIIIACSALLACAKAETEAEKSARLNALFKADQLKMITEFFNAQTKGASVKAFGCANEPNSLIALKSWSVVDEQSVDSTAGIYTIRAESSNQAGLSVTKLWRLQVGKENGKFCVESFGEKQ